MPFRMVAYLIALVVLASAGCSAGPTDQEVNPLVLPSVAAPVSIGETPTSPPPPASPTPACIDDLRFLEDVTIPDGTQVDPGSVMDKRWLVQNPSNCNWDSSYSLRLITGSELGAVSPQPLFPAIAGSEVTIRVLYTAPRQPGIYRSAWQAHNPLGIPFGDPIFIEVWIP